MRDGTWEEFKERYWEEKVIRMDSRKNTRRLRQSGKDEIGRLGIEQAN